MGYFELFGDCYPHLEITGEMFGQLLDTDGCTFFEHRENGETAGFAAVNTAVMASARSFSHRRRSISGKVTARSFSGDIPRGCLSVPLFQRRTLTKGAFRSLKSVDMFLMTAALKWSFCLMIFLLRRFICP